MKNKTNNITSFNEDVSKWYSDIVLQADLISYGPVKGTMFLKPYGFAIWNNITKQLNDMFIENEVEQVQFPMLFPESYLTKEADHVEGFAPEVFVVTKVGTKTLNENYIIRPTSETLFGTYFKENITSYSQLPMKLNQWVNVMRWENNTRPFLRNSEFFWQEGHTVHTTPEEAEDFSRVMAKVYKDFANNNCLLPVIPGEKTVTERFAGAKNTFTIETILRDGQALQSATSHFLGDKFGKAFDVKVRGKDNEVLHPFQTSWGMSTRIVGAVIMTHSDDKGLVLPSSIAPFQSVILTVFADKDERVLEVANKINKKLTGLRTKLDSSDKGIGYKSQTWEVKGVPIRIEVGPRDIEEGNVTIAIRNQEEKIKVSIDSIDEDYINNLLKEYDKTIFESAEKVVKEKRVNITSVEEISDIVSNGKYAVAPWVEDAELEEKIKEDTGATIRCIIEGDEAESINAKGKTNKYAVIARAY